MEIRHLKYFVTVARCNSFSRAAETLHVSQSAISKLIKDLESELGFFLFHRDARRIQLTEAGATFLEQTEDLVTRFESLIPEMAQAVQLDRGRITIGLPPITGATRFSHLLGAFKQQYPQIEIDLFERGSQQIERGIQEGHLDIGIICNIAALHNYDVLPLSHDPLWVLLPSNHPLASADAIELQQLRQESFIMYHEEFSLHQEILTACLQTGFQPHIIFKTAQLELMTQLTANNLGVALLPRQTCTTINDSRLAVRPLSIPALYHSMSVIWKKKRHLSRAALLWIQFADKYLQEGPNPTP